MNIEHTFDSLGDFLAKANSASDCAMEHRSSRKPKSDDKSFYHTESYETAEHMARYGWPEGLAKIEEYYKKIKTDITAIGKVFQPIEDVTGQEVEMGKFLTGDPECMFRFVEQEIPGQKQITMGMNCTAAWHISTDEFFRRGAATMVLLDYLEDNGYSCGIALQNYVSSGSHTFFSEVNLKNPGEPLDQDKITFMSCNADVLRRLFFSLKETEPYDVRRAFGFGMDTSGGYGHVSRIADKHKKDLQIPELGSQEWSDFGNAEKWIIEQLKKQGVAIIE